MKRILTAAAVVASLVAVAEITPAQFQNPDRKYGPYVWWHWMNGNITKEGITADLEALAETGVDGATLFDASCDIRPAGPVTFNTPAFFECIRHACREANRLGLKLSIANGTGWANSGGPWVPPEDGMKYVTVSETPVVGPTHFEAVLPRIRRNDENALSNVGKGDAANEGQIMTDDHGFYDDIAVMAVKGIARKIPATVKIDKNVALATLERPTAIPGFSWRLVYPWISNRSGRLIVEISQDGTTFSKLEELPIHVSYFNTQLNGCRRHTFRRPVTAKALRVTVEDEARYWKIAFANLDLFDDQRIDDSEGKCLRYKFPVSPMTLDEQVTPPIRPDEIVYLTQKMDRAGKLVWDVPPGEWTILRVGYHANGKLVSSSGTSAGRGPEVDKLSVKPVERHFEAYVGRLMRYLGKDGSAIRGVLNDSFEAESQNWTQGFEKEFETLRGYSILPFLPAFTGRIVGSVAETEKFLGDLREVLYELFARNYAGTMLRKAHEYGLDFYLEPYGNAPTDDFKYGRYCDMPMTEFWSRSSVENYWMSTGPTLGYVEQVVHAADTWGHNIVGAEAFTASAGYGRWQVYPYSLKVQCDHVYQLGVNRIFFHRFCHQPWKTPKLPGMTMGPWGMHFDRTQTWWKEAKEFVRYQTRCQYLLQEGYKVKDDVCHRRDKFADWYFVTSSNRTETVVEKVCNLTGRVPEIWYPVSGETVRAADWRVMGDKTVVSVRLPMAGCAFVVFRNSNPDVPRELKLASASSAPLRAPWKISFRSPLGDDPAPTETSKLFAWNASENREVKYFSGTATYETSFFASELKPDERLVLDLGAVKDFATVSVNGQTLRTLWMPPFEIDVTRFVKAGNNDLSVRVTNRWPNRLIGDDFLPEAERKTWTSWRHWTKKDKLLESGLLGPVALKTMKEVK